MTIDYSTCAKGYDTYQGDDNPETPQKLNFDVAILAGMLFAFIKGRQGKYGDILFTDSWQRAKLAGLLRSAYDWLTPDTDPVVQATVFVGQMGGDFGEIPPVVDYETQPDGWPQWSDAGRARNYLKQWLETVKRLTGMTPIIYTGPAYWQKFGSADSYWAQYPLWLAQYSNDHVTPLKTLTIPKPWTTWEFMQYGDHLDGLRIGLESKDGDYDFFNGTPAQLMTKYGKGVQPPVVIPPVTAPPVVTPPAFIGATITLTISADGTPAIRDWSKS